ncbi:MAG: hypothetical protein H6742_21305 [Alphaproteobacteria bacterium]|nr:hypothetical protein [Alphaproteobacteria bacterium]
MSGSALSPGLRPDRTSLSALVAVWADRRTGRFAAPGAQGTVDVVDGEPRDAAGLVWLATAVCRPGLRFVPMTGGGTAQLGSRLGATLLEAGRRAADRAGLQGLERGRLVVGPRGDALERLPLRAASRRVLREVAGRREPLLQTLDHIGIAPELVAEDLAALVALGLVQLRPGESRWSASSVDTGERNRLAIRRLQARLDRDWSTLRDADDWQVLGVPKDAPPDLVARGAARMRHRYAQADEGVDDEISRETVRQVRARVEAAIEHLGAAAEQHDPPESPDPARALRLGQAAAVSGDLAQARRWLSVAARKDEHDPEIMAWYGWVLVVDPTVRSDRARRRGLALLAMARAVAPDDPAVRARCAEAALEAGEVQDAAADVARLAELAPEHGELARLRHRLRRAGAVT